ENWPGETGQRSGGSRVRNRVALPGRKQLLPHAGECSRGQRLLVLRAEWPPRRGEARACARRIGRLAFAACGNARRSRRGLLQRQETDRRSRHTVHCAGQGWRVDESRFAHPVRRPHRDSTRALMGAFLALALLLPVRMAAQQGAEARTTNASEGEGRLRVVAATVPISMDGRLNGPAWASADSITDFRQREPAAG